MSKRIQLPKPHPGQEQIKREAKRYNVVCCGRRFGKTILGIDRCIAPEVLQYPVGWFSPTYKMLVEVWREVERVTQPITVRKSVQDHRLEFSTGGTLEFWSLDNPNVARGRKYKRIIGDEWAMVQNSLDAWNFVLRPTLVDYVGDAWFLSTPKGHNGFWQMWQYGNDVTMHDWACWQMPTASNPKIPMSEIEAMRLTMPERVYSQEILAQFIDDAGGVFRNVVELSTVPPLRVPTKDQQIIFGVDWGKSNDFTVISAIDVGTRQQVYLDRFNQIDYHVQIGRLQAAYERFKPITIIGESNSIGTPLIEQMVRMGLPVRAFTTTNATKTTIIDSLALAMERKEIQLVNDQTQMSELQAYEMERLPSGLMRYSAPDGMHDDTVMALALAWYGASAPRADTLVDFA